MTDFSTIQTINDFRNLNVNEKNDFLRKTDCEYPTKQNFQTVTIKNIIDLIVVESGMSISDFREKHPDLKFLSKENKVQLDKYVVEVTTDEKALAEANKAYQTENARRFDIFESYLQDEYLEYEMKKQEVHNQVYSLAYQQGHSGGYGDIESQYAEIASVVNNVITIVTT